MKLLKIEIPNSLSTQSGDTIDLTFNIGYKFICVEVDTLTNKPYLFYLGSGDTQAPTVTEKFMYVACDDFATQDMGTWSADYLGKYETIAPTAKKFHFFNIY